MLCTTVGETAADFLNSNLGMGLTGVSLLMSALLTVVLVVQFRTKAYRPGIYWFAVALITREAYYWLAVLFTFALGTSAGDLVAEKMALGYWVSAVLFGLAIAAVAVPHFALGLNAVPSFWIAYILTRPLGASMGDPLAADRRRRPGPGHHGHQRAVPRGHPRSGGVPVDDPQGRHRVRAGAQPP